MAEQNYKQSDIAGTTYKRVSQITINNPLDNTPSLTMHLYFDAVNIEFVVTGQLPVFVPHLFFLGDLITPPVTVTDNLFFFGDEI